VHGFRCYDNIHVYKLIASYTANAYSSEREMIASACNRSMPAVMNLNFRQDLLADVIRDVIAC